MINGIHHVAVSTPNLERLIEFYTTHLGFEVVMETQWSDRPEVDEIIGLKKSAARQAMLRAGNTHIEVFQYESPVGAPNDPTRPASDHGYTHFCLDVSDIDAEYERLVAAGMTFNCAPRPAKELGSGKIRAVYGRDPDGNIIELQEILDQTLAFALPELVTGIPKGATS